MRSFLIQLLVLNSNSNDFPLHEVWQNWKCDRFARNSMVQERNCALTLRRSLCRSLEGVLPGEGGRGRGGEEEEEEGVICCSATFISGAAIGRAIHLSAAAAAAAAALITQLRSSSACKRADVRPARGRTGEGVLIVAPRREFVLSNPFPKYYEKQLRAAVKQFP